MPRKLTQGDALERFIKKHGDEYNYSHVEYVDRDTKVKIICKKDGHGVFNQIPSDHYRYGCPDCGILKRSNSRKSTKAQFIEDKRKLEKMVYIETTSIRKKPIKK